MKDLPVFGKSKIKKPNIILCIADDQGWGDVGYSGHPVLKTPNIDEMAANALRFDRFYAAAPVCSPTRASVLTGRHPNRFGCFTWGCTLRPQEITIAESLKKAGYVTGHFGKWHLGSVLKNSPLNPGSSGFDEWVSSPNYFDNDPILSKMGTAVQYKGESSIVTVEVALEFIRKNTKSSQPFLAVIWFGSPHNPHDAAQENKVLYKNKNEKLQNFYGEITGIDNAIGKLRNELRVLDIHQNTMLWYCSDNGGLKVSRTGGRGHKSEIYEGGLRVPALLEWPEFITAPRITNAPCTTSDIYPTIMEFAEIKVNKELPLDGISLVPLIANKTKARSKPIGFWSYPSQGVVMSSKDEMTGLFESQKTRKEVNDLPSMSNVGTISQKYSYNSFLGHAAWLNWPYKLHRIENQQGIKMELYDLAKDSMESNNLSAKPDITKKMRSELEHWMKSVVRSLNGEDYKSIKLEKQ
ncbi:MAG: N-acetylgalactosamine 6-sulfate sulfatase [Planctomycetes bacterium GWF2_41_51]|nr:MAG: N-acetylgalactosamine 6-sulfate sulfatase [Planctomycetes bacterium GWF2_41_51]